MFAELQETRPDRRADGGASRTQRVGARSVGSRCATANAERALAAYQAHDRLHIADTREEGGGADGRPTGTRHAGSTPEGRTVMLTDASNKELDRINALAQEHRAQAGELGERPRRTPRPPLRPRGGRRGDLHRTHLPAGAGASARTARPARSSTQPKTSGLTIETHGANEREVNVDTEEFQDLRLAYAQHVYKAQGLTAERALRADRRLADRPRARLRRAHPRTRANRHLRLPRGPRRAGHGHRRDRTPRRTR